jgi:hypothetical protein
VIPPPALASVAVLLATARDLLRAYERDLPTTSAFVSWDRDDAEPWRVLYRAHERDL